MLLTFYRIDIRFRRQASFGKISADVEFKYFTPRLTEAMAVSCLVVGGGSHRRGFVRYSWSVRCR